MADLPTYEFSNEGVESAIQALDGRANEVAATLSNWGFRGIKGNECECPIARYVLTVIPSASRAFVYIDEDGDALVSVERCDEARRRESAGAVAFGGIPMFVRRFDRGLYPDLIEEVSDAAAH